MSSPLFKLLALVCLCLTASRVSADGDTTLADAGNANQPAAAAAPLVTVGTNFNGGGPFQAELPEQIFRNASAGNWPVPPISAHDLASGITPVVLVGAVHSLSGAPAKLTDGQGASGEDDPANCFLFENSVPLGRFRISLDRPEAIGQINLYSWHRNGQFGGARAPLRASVYASDGTTAGFNSDDPNGPGYVLLAQVNTLRPGGVNGQGGQHGASIVSPDGQPLGKFRHFLFEVTPPIDGQVHTFFTEVDIVATAAAKVVAADGAGSRFFDDQIAPLLARHCLDCHNPTDKKGGLDLTAGAAAAAGGDSGPAFKPAAPSESLLLDRIADDEMPPKHPLHPDEKQMLHQWIAAGAVWGTTPIDRFRYSSEHRAGFDWWSLQPIAAQELPAAGQVDWLAGPIDRWILSRLEREHLSPAPPADRRALIRRVTFDLTGLPPTPQEIEAFARDDSPQAYEQLVDRLLASPHYGERWARHWLDVVRYSENQGFERNKHYPSAWKYRDWVVAAFNSDMPYDEFVRLQLAGDVLHPGDPAATVATGYLVVTPHDLLGLTQGSAAMKAATREEELENLIGNIGQTFLGLTVNCARCHDHKFDPLAQTEYFRLASAVGGLVRHGVTVSAPATDVSAGRQADRSAAVDSAERELASSLGADGTTIIAEVRAAAIKEAEEALAKAKAAVEEREKNAPKEGNGLQVTEDRRRDLHAAEDLLVYARQPHSTLGLDSLLRRIPPASADVCNRALSELSAVEMRDRLALGGTAMGFATPPPLYYHVMRRGSFRDLDELVSPGGFRCLATLPADWGLPANAPAGERRLKLAQWISDPRNPLPARVIVNRLWHYHFGAGLVDTPSDFGFNGGRPSHPELLDYLAADLVKHGWSLKAIQRQIVLSATYRQSSRFNAEAAKIDSADRLLWRKAPQRLDAESVRDAVLAVSGELNLRMGGPSFRDFEVDKAADNINYTLSGAFGPATNRRSIYRTIARAAAYPLLESLDCADPAVSTPRRSVTTTPLQALSLINNSFMREAAAAMSRRVQQEAPDELDRQIDRVYHLAFGRAPNQGELASARTFSAQFGLAEFCLVIFNSNEFLFID